MNDLKQEILSLPEVKRIQELENYIDHNKELNQKLDDLKMLQQKMVNAKEYHQAKQYAEYKKQYNFLYEKILDFPFVEEYLELLEEVNQTLLNITNFIQNKINHYLN